MLLAHFAKAKTGDKVLDMGTGTGIIPILMSSLTKADHFTCLEIQEESVEITRRSIGLNKLDNRIDVVHGDIKEAADIFPHNTFNVITCNPPYMIDNHGLKNLDEPKAIARHEILCSLSDVLINASKILKSSGHYYMVHRPFRLSEIFVKMSACGLEPKRMRLVQPYADKEPNIVLIEGIKGASSGLIVESPLCVYDKPGQYSKEYLDIYES